MKVREVVVVGEKKEKENSRLPSSDPAMENVIAGPCLPGLDDGPGCQRPSQGTSEVLDVLQFSSVQFSRSVMSDFATP